MKHFILVASALFSFAAFGQELTTSNADTHVSGFTGTAGAATLSSHIDVVNGTDQDLTLMCSREILFQEAAAGTERFCWGGLCYESGQETSLFSQTLAAGATAESVDDNTGFTGYYEYNGEDGACQIKYKFFDVDDEEVFTEIIVHFCVGTTADCNQFLSTEEVTSEVTETQVSPNPASGKFLISYSLATTAVNSRIVIRDALGKEVKALNLNSQVGVINLNALDFDTGMYFYTIENNGKTENTKRLIISH